MSNIFRELLKKIGSGTHTAKNLTRDQAKLATKMILLEEATPAQIGAFLIAHRIKRPTAEELAGMLDAYDELAPKLQLNLTSFQQPITVFGNPYDGRSRTVSVTPITALILAASGVPVVMHGGRRMPTKYGLSLIEIWQGLGIDFTHLSQQQTEELINKTGLGFVYVPQHFPLINQLIEYREQIGKRPTFATLELIWSPCADNFHLVSGFVHPPTEDRCRETLKLRNVQNYTFIKGLEGSCDLSLGRTGIIGLGKGNANQSFERLLLHPQEYGFPHHDLALVSPSQAITEITKVLQGKSSQLMPAAIYNGGFYLWRCGICSDLKSGFDRAEAILLQGKAASKLKEICFEGC